LKVKIYDKSGTIESDLSKYASRAV